MSQADKKRERRGDRYRIVLEFEHEDKERLDALVERYRPLLTDPTKSNKVFVVRQLLRFAEKSKKLPPVAE